jgi:hypothetical protein
VLALRPSKPRSRCEVLEGIVISDSTPPRLGALSGSFSACAEPSTFVRSGDLRRDTGRSAARHSAAERHNHGVWVRESVL